MFEIPLSLFKVQRILCRDAIEYDCHRSENYLQDKLISKNKNSDYIDPLALWILIRICGWASPMVGSLHMHRSTLLLSMADVQFLKSFLEPCHLTDRYKKSISKAGRKGGPPLEIDL
jgi:hypothetical protein